MSKKLVLFALCLMAPMAACSHAESTKKVATDNAASVTVPADQPRPAASSKPVPPPIAIPAGWQKQWSADGDLNGDGVADHVMILKQGDNGPRRLLISFAKADGSSSTVADTEAFLPKVEDGIDPLADDNPLEIKNRTIRVTVPDDAMYGANHATYIFRYQNERFELIGYDSYNQDKESGDYDEESFNYSTGVVQHETGNVAQGKPMIKKSRIANGPKPLLTSINLTQGFTPPTTGD